MTRYSIDAKLGIVLLVSVALISGAALLKAEYKARPKVLGRDNITLYDKRFDGLRKILPPHGTVGYLSDITITDYNRMTDATAIAQYYLVQYAVAPVVVKNSMEHQLIIGNFHQPTDYQKITEKTGLSIVKDFDNGVVLFKAGAK